MERAKSFTDGKFGSSKVSLEKEYRENYDNDMTFRDIANKLDMAPEVLMKYTSKLEISSCEMKNCKKCKNILECKNEVNGYVYYPIKSDNNIEFCYVPCKYKLSMDKQNEFQNNIMYFDIPLEIRNASMKNIDINDKNRFPVIKWINSYINDTNEVIYRKGIYLNGNFGCGKTYLISAMLNELAKKGKKVAMIYYPEFLRALKESFGADEEFKNKFNYIKKVPFLLLDDIGAETVTEWSRDEILGTILQYRMEEKLPTFFTSNLTMDELENHLSTTSKQVDKVKSKRIIERIKQLTEEVVMISENKRK